MRFAKNLVLSADWMRRSLLELWGMAVVACTVGFMGPFGTYGEGDLVHRVWRWACFLAGAYVLVRPAIALGRMLARRTGLPETQVLVWVTVLSSLPVAAIWMWGSVALFDARLQSPEILSFALICSHAVLAVVWWSGWLDRGHGRPIEQASAPVALAPPPASSSPPRLFARLGSGFSGPVLALQSEDHYVRVHGPGQSALVLMRLRDAIAEMDGVEGQHVHRSWWVARAAMRGWERSGRSYRLHLGNGLTVPIARDLAHELTGIAEIRPGSQSASAV